MKEQSGVPSNKLNDCPSLGERFTGGGGHTDVMKFIKDYRSRVVVISLFSSVQGRKRNAVCLQILGTLNTIPQLKVC